MYKIAARVVLLEGEFGNFTRSVRPVSGSDRRSALVRNVLQVQVY